MEIREIREKILLQYRIIDESGEDYLYPKEDFEIVDDYKW